MSLIVLHIRELGRDRIRPFKFRCGGETLQVLFDTGRPYSYMAVTYRLRAGLIHTRGSVQEWKRRSAIFATVNKLLPG